MKDKNFMNLPELGLKMFTGGKKNTNTSLRNASIKYFL